MAFIGAGGMARHHLRRVLQQQDTTQIAYVCEPSANAYEAFCDICDQAGLAPPPNVPVLEDLLDAHADELDAVFIVTPHAFHFHHAQACLEAGLDVLLEKPMVLNAQEAQELIATRDRTGKLLVVSFNGSLSPQIRTAARMLRSGELGAILNIHAVAYQGWKTATTGAWRQIPAVAGGGFLFDTGAHMLNTVADLAGEDFVEVAAWLDNRDAPVDILGVAIGRLRSGALVTLSGCGELPPKMIGSDVSVFCTGGLLQTGIWGEKLLLQKPGDPMPEPVEVPASLGQWQQFLAVRAGSIANPCPPEVGLRMAKLWDAIQASARQNGQPVTVR